MPKAVIRPIGTIRNESTYKVAIGESEGTVVHSTPVSIWRSTFDIGFIHCVTCDRPACAHATAIREALNAQGGL